MGEAIITRRGASNGVDSDAFAFIIVTYSGGTCTCTNGTETLTHSGGGTYSFGVDQAGTYTVTATETYSSDTKSVTISQKGEIKEVTLTYTYTLFDNGVVNGIPWISSGRSAIGSTIYVFADALYGDDSTCWLAHASTQNKVDLTNYNTLYFTVSNALCDGTSYENYSRAGVSNNNAVGSRYGNAGNLTSYVTVCSRDSEYRTTRTLSVNISSAGNVYVKIAAEADDNGVTGSAWSYATITKIWATS